MSRTVKDGWHKVYGRDVYVEDGIVKRATTGEGMSYRPAGIYESIPFREGGGWLNVSGEYTLEQVRRKIKSGKIKIM